MCRLNEGVLTSFHVFIYLRWNFEVGVFFFFYLNHQCEFHCHFQ